MSVPQNLHFVEMLIGCLYCLIHLIIGSKLVGSEMGSARPITYNFISDVCDNNARTKPTINEPARIKNETNPTNPIRIKNSSGRNRPAKMRIAPINACLRFQRDLYSIELI